MKNLLRHFLLLLMLSLATVSFGQHNESNTTISVFAGVQEALEFEPFSAALISPYKKFESGILIGFQRAKEWKYFSYSSDIIYTRNGLDMTGKDITHPFIHAISLNTKLWLSPIPNHYRLSVKVGTGIGLQGYRTPAFTLQRKSGFDDKEREVRISSITAATPTLGLGASVSYRFTDRVGAMLTGSSDISPLFGFLTQTIFHSTHVGVTYKL